MTLFTSTDSSPSSISLMGIMKTSHWEIQGRVKIYANLRNLNMAETQSTDLVSSLINIYNYYFSISKIQTIITRIRRTGNSYRI